MDRSHPKMVGEHAYTVLWTVDHREVEWIRRHRRLDSQPRSGLLQKQFLWLAWRGMLTLSRRWLLMPLCYRTWMDLRG